MDSYALNNTIKCLTEIKEIGNESIVAASNHLALLWILMLSIMALNALQRSKEMKA